MFYDINNKNTIVYLENLYICHVIVSKRAQPRRNDDEHKLFG